MIVVTSRVSLLPALVVALAAHAGAAAAQTFTVSQPRGHVTARDFASDVIRDPWDFEQASDYNQMYSLDPADPTQSAWSGRPLVEGGVFTGLSRTTGPTISLQFEGIDGGFNMATRSGVRFPIDARRYRRLSMRVRRSAAPAQGEYASVTWFTATTRTTETRGARLFALRGYDGFSQRYHNQMPFVAQASGWQILTVDLDQATPVSFDTPWAGVVRGFEVRLGDGQHMVGATIDLDWVRLTERGTAVADLSFAGFGGSVSVTARHQATGDVVQVYPASGEATTFADGTTFRWDYGFLPPGAWTLTATRGGVSRSRELVIDPPPVIEILDPDVSGGRDFATTVIGDPWDLANSEDITRYGRLYDIGSPSFGPDGLTATTLGPGGDLPTFGDGFVAFVDDSLTYPRERVIPADEYARLTFTLEYLTGKELPGPVALLPQWGSIARIIWRGRDFGRGGAYSQTRPIVMLDGGPTMVSLDLRTLSTTGPVEPALEPGPPTLWTGEIGILRVDIDEAREVDRPFRLGAVRLAADDEADAYGRFSIRWRTADATFSREVASANGSDATVVFSYDTDADPSSGLIPIATGVPADAGVVPWDVSRLAPGTYFVHATLTDVAGNTHSAYSTGPVRVTGGYLPWADADSDGLPDGWEARYGDLAPREDADEDEVSNLDEFLDGTDPLLSNRWTLSEGATGTFTERLALANPNPEPAALSITYLREGLAPITRDHTVAGLGRTTVTVNDVPGLANAAVSAVIDVRSGGIVAERTMFWGEGHYGGHTGKALARSRHEWYLAEGEASVFDTYVLFANPNEAAATVALTFLLEGGLPPIEHVFTVPGLSRLTLDVEQVPGVAGTAFSATVVSSLPITVERAMYFSAPGQFWAGGHATAAVAAPGTEWFAAEGRTGPLFDMFLLLANPADQENPATIRYLLPGGGVVSQEWKLSPRSRTTVWVNQVPGLSATDVSASVTAERPIIVERAMYWSGGPGRWQEAHASAALTTTGTRWVLAEGEQGGSLGYDTFVLLANPGDRNAAVRVTLLRAGGRPPVSQDVPVPANGRATLNGSQFGLDPGEQFGILVNSTNGVPIVVERAMYWNGGGQFWGGGSNETGVRLR